jgi:glycosyltransferase involved in cell wall biosynthesis
MADAILVYSGFAQDYFSKMNSHVALLEPLPATYANDYSGKVDRSSSETVVGYAGTASHAADFEPLVPAIRKLLETPNLRFDFIGYCPPELLGMEHVRLTPWIDRYEDYLAALTLRRWDIGLAPLKDTLFNNCKTNLKFREYAALGIAGIYSDIPLYRGCVRDGENGLLVSNTAEAWHRGIQKLAGDTKLRSRIRAASEEEAKTKYTVEKSARELMKLVQALSAGESKPANVHLPRPWVFLYALARPFGIALAVFIQLVASIRHRTFWKEVLEIRRKRSSHLTEG